MRLDLCLHSMHIPKKATGLFMRGADRIPMQCLILYICICSQNMTELTRGFQGACAAQDRNAHVGEQASGHKGKCNMAQVFLTAWHSLTHAGAALMKEIR